MKYRRLGKSGLKVSELSFGSWVTFGDQVNNAVAESCLKTAYDAGINFFDTADMYSVGESERVVGKALNDYAPREDFVLATKVYNPMGDGPNDRGLSRKHVMHAIDASLTRLGMDHVDLYYLHRVDPATAIEETVAAMAELVTEGKVRAIGLSEASGETIRRAAKIHPISAVQSEYSIFARDVETDVIPACLEVGASLTAYSPLGRGMLSGRFKNESLAEGDWRASNPRFQGEAYNANVALVDEIEVVASHKGCAPAQVALAWVIGQGEHVLTIPGTTKLENLKSNLGSYNVELTPEELAKLDSLADRVIGERYDERGMAAIDG